MDVPVGYATAHDSTRTIAERTAAVLNRAGRTAEARPMTGVEDADAYRSFVLGSAVHGQGRLPPARQFVRDNLDVLGPRPVWIFSVGMPAALRGPLRRMAAKELSAIEEGLPPGLGYGTTACSPVSSNGTSCPVPDACCFIWPADGSATSGTGAPSTAGQRPSPRNSEWTDDACTPFG
ncbi:flavodoxin domain-containing protein [Streptomyces sp. NPDC058625]|uniref:flavodoxin domain-containing protein n=1 Tax=Streptomyces sp. NPDC058625 TaxID=3346564 RepID=UPI0036566FBC